ncbi:MAG TPA: hypothetical protein VD886_15980 [Herpetosiphonaceae bacterium]|nr:hypothetical protein [Herpetosiphonaceae bacterium]
MRRLTIGLLLILLAGCASSAGPTAPTTQPGQLAERPTVTSAAPPPPTSGSPPAGSRPAEISIVYESPEEGAVRSITAAGVLRELAEPTGNPHRVPWSASPDGRTVAVVVLRGKTPKDGFDRATLWTAGIDESNPTQLLDLTHPAPDQLDSIDAASLDSALGNPGFQRLAWSADGTQIIVASAHEGQVDLYAVPAAGGAPRRLTDTPALEFAATLSPDGSRIAYASASSFGTGAGWSDPAAAVQDLDGSSAGSITIESGSVELAGWLNNETIIALTRDGGTGRTTILALGNGSAPRRISSGSTQISWGLWPGMFVFADASGPSAGSIVPVAIWDGSAPRETYLEVSATQLRVSPDPELMLLCTEYAVGQVRREIWRAGEGVEIGDGACGDAQWADDGALAVGGARDQEPLIVGPDGGVRGKLPAGSILAGWAGADLYFFAPSGAGAWQLYRLNGAGQDAPAPVGPALAFPPAEPRIVASR